jgi:spore coat protein CotF
MKDKSTMENLLLLQKGVCDLYLHGSIESPSEQVHSMFCSSLNESICMQSDIYAKMQSKGWYTAEKAEDQKVTKVKNQFSGTN